MFELNSICMHTLQRACDPRDRAKQISMRIGSVNVTILHLNFGRILLTKISE